MSRALTHRERDVLDALLTVELEDAATLRDDARSVRVVGTCSCGCPTIYFTDGSGITPRVDASITGSDDTLFLFTVDGRLGGIEWVGVADDVPRELPDPSRRVVSPAR
jgi:hypothetical protein